MRRTSVLLSNSIDYYRIDPNRRAVREWEGLGARLLISQKWGECGHSSASKLVDN